MNNANITNQINNQNCAIKFSSDVFCIGYSIYFFIHLHTLLI